MSTHCSISLKEGNTIKTIYCHTDGHPDRVGAILAIDYKDKQKVEKLLEMGDLQALRENLTPVPYKVVKRLFRKPLEYGRTFDPKTMRTIDTTEAHHPRTNPWNGVVLPSEDKDSQFFTPARIYDTIIKRCEEYNYVYENGVWYFYHAISPEPSFTINQCANLYEHLIATVFGFDRINVKVYE